MPCSNVGILLHRGTCMQ